MNKTYLTIILILLGLILLGTGYYFLNKDEGAIVCTQEAKECPDGSFVSRKPPKCEFDLCPGEAEGIFVFSPKKEDIINSSLKIRGQAKGSWYFEGQFNAELYDEYDYLAGTAILTAKDNWMTEDFVAFEGELEFSGFSSDTGWLRFLSANPSGLPENQKTYEIPIKFESPKTKILLYYYNPELDKDASENIKCSRDGLVAIEKEISVNQTSIPEVINILLKGKENLSSEQLAEGITTEFPLEGLILESTVLRADGTLVLTFNDTLNKTSGGSCRASVLWFQIEETAKQFTDVVRVEFEPEEVFQP